MGAVSRFEQRAAVGAGRVQDAAGYAEGTRVKPSLPIARLLFLLGYAVVVALVVGALTRYDSGTPATGEAAAAGASAVAHPGLRPLAVNRFPALVRHGPIAVRPRASIARVAPARVTRAVSPARAAPAAVSAPAATPVQHASLPASSSVATQQPAPVSQPATNPSSGGQAQQGVGGGLGSKAPSSTPTKAASRHSGIVSGGG